MARFADIKRFTECRYSVNYTFSDVWEGIERFQQKYNLELNPDFQQGHVWTNEQATKWLEFILKGGKSSLDIYFNHPFWNDGRLKGSMVCVDGLQRLTAIRKFFNDEVRVFGSLFSEFEDFVPSDIMLNFHINDLKTRKEVLQWYIDFNTGGTKHSNEEIDRVRKLMLETT